MLKIHKYYKQIRIFIILLFICSVIYIYIDYRRSKKRKYYFISNKNNIISVKKLSENFNKYTKLIVGNNIYESNYILPCGDYQKFKNNMILYIKKYKNKTFFVLPNTIYINNIWKLLVDFYGSKEASEITTYSYILPNEYDKYKKEYSIKNKIVFKKKNSKEIFVTNSLISLSNIKKENFLIAQKFIVNNLLYHNRKILFRLYLFLIITENGLKAYLYNDGLMYYTQNKYNFKNNKEIYNISLFTNTDELYYKGYPITFNNFLKTLHEKNANKLYNNTMSHIKKIVYSMKHLIGNNNYNKNTLCEIINLDFYPTELYSCRVLECNTYLTEKIFTKEEENLKYNLFKNIIKLLEYDNSNNLKKIV